MLGSFIVHRPRELTAVYVEHRKIEVLRAHRQWRNWQIDSAEHFAPHLLDRFYSDLKRSWQIDSPEQIPESDGEPLFDVLQRLNIRPKSRKGSALLLILPRSYYCFHREVYPASLQDRLEEALTFDWQENLFHEHASSLYFAGNPVSVDHYLSVPIFSIQRDIYEKFEEVLGSNFFETFAVIPSVLSYSFFVATPSADEDSPNQQLLGRILDESQMEINRFHDGQLIDSVLVHRGNNDLNIFRENMRCIEGAESQEPLRLLATWTSEECTGDYGRVWEENENLPIQVHTLQDPLVSYMVKHLTEQEKIRTFDIPLVLKPWEIPKVVWPLLGVVGLFLMFSLFQLYFLHRAKVDDSNLTKQIAQLESQWKPIERLQTQITKLQEDQKTLSEFKRTGYPLLEMLTLLTQMTPEDTWLNYLSLRNDQLMLRGESKSAIKYLSDLSKIEGFTDVRFASPVTRNPSSDLERFNVQLQLDLDKLHKSADSLSPAQIGERTAAEKPTETKVPQPDSVNKTPDDMGQPHLNESNESADNITR